MISTSKTEIPARAFGVLRAFVLCIGAAAALAQTPALAHSPDKKGSTDAKHTAMPGMAGGDMQGHMKGMMKNMESMKPSGDTDKDFAMMMKMHHQGAIDMAEMELKNGKDATLRSMAKKIIKDQQKEIKDLDKWLAKQK